MNYSLPTPKIDALKRLLASKKFRLRLVTILDIIMIAVILIYGRQPAKTLITPLVSSWPSFASITQKKITHETFAFVPDLAPNKFPDIDLNGLTNLTFFDIPLTEDGEMNYDSRGYQSFTSGQAADLFDRARYQKIKIFLTLSAFDGDIIRNLLDRPDNWQKLADQLTEEIENSNIDGINVDFEFPKGGGKEYQAKFTSFINLLKNSIHSKIPEARLAVAIPSSLINNQSIYNIEALSKISDRLFVIASNFIVPEVKNTSPVNPKFGFNEHEYFTNISSLLKTLQQKVSSEKLVLERAWYGNGNNYPLYTPKNRPEPEEDKQPASIWVDRETVDRLVVGVPEKGREAARRNIPLIAKALDEEGILDSNVLAYALATVEHETDETFEPINEIQGQINARRFGYEGGSNYFGRGFIQITHLRNYRQIGERIGMGDSLVKNPELAGNPEVAAKILAAFFKDNNVANLASRGNFVAARGPVNPDYNGYSVARLAMKYEIY